MRRSEKPKEVYVGKSDERFCVFIEPGECWGRIVGEDSDTGACQVCVEMCPEVFEKPGANRCARTRSDVDPAAYAGRVYQVAQCCPVDAIRITNSAERNGAYRTDN